MIIRTSSLPLAGVLRPHSEGGARAETISFSKFLSVLKKNLETAGDHFGDLDFIIDHINLFGRLPKKISKVSRFRDLRKGAMVWFLGKHTYWFNRLAPDTKSYLKRRLYSGDIDISDIKRYVDSATGVMSSLLLSFPELFQGGDPYQFADRVNNAVISGCIYGYKSFTRVVKRTRKHIKKKVLMGLEDISTSDIPRELSFLYGIIPILNKGQNTKMCAYRALTFCQTRAWGIADSSIGEDSMKKFIHTVTSEHKEFPDGWFRDRLTFIFSKLKVSTLARSLASTKISLSSNSSADFPRKKGGKNYAYNRHIASAPDTIPRFDLNTGQVLGEIRKAHDNMGEFLFHLALSKWDSSQFLDCRLGVVLENAKARTVTSSHELHSLLLQPLSHFLLESLRSFPECRSGISAARHLWSFYKGMSRDRFDQVIEGKLFGLSYDLEEATDYGNWQVVHAVFDILDASRIIPKWYLEVCRHLLTSPRRIFVPDVLNDFIKTLPPDDWGIDEKRFSYSMRAPISFVRTKRGQLMGDTCIKAILTVSQLACIYQARWEEKSLFSLASVVGDDGVGISENIHHHQARLNALTCIGYKLSDYDTFISRFCITFSEECMLVPSDRYQSYSYIRSNGWIRLPYIDIVPIRTIIDSQPQFEALSTTSIGKYYHLGSEMMYVRPIPFSRSMVKFASVIQATNIPFTRLERFPYLPRFLGGCGILPPSFDFLIETSQRYRGAEYRRIIPGLFAYIYRCMLYGFHIGVSPSVTQKVHFKGANFLEFRVPLPVKEEPDVPFEDIDNDTYLQLTLPRLSKDGYLVGKSTYAAYLRYRMVVELICDFRGSPREFNETLETMFQSDEFKEFDIPLEHLSRSMFKRVITALEDSSEGFIKRNTLESMYLGSRVDECFKPLRVHLFDDHGDGPCVFDKPSFETNQLRNWFEGYYLYGNSGDPPPALHVADDPLLIQGAIDCDEEIILITTDDIKLCNRMQSVCPGKTILRLPMAAWAALVVTAENPEKEMFHLICRQLWLPITTPMRYKFLFDTGSFSSYEERSFRDGVHVGTAFMNDDWFVKTSERLYQVKYTAPTHISVLRSMIRLCEVKYYYAKEEQPF